MTKSLNWSDEQKAVFNWFEKGCGNLVVESRAGGSKTTVIEYGVTKAPEKKILYLVFNKKNCVEATERIKDPRVTIKTHHGFAFSYIKRMWPKCRADTFVESDRVKAVCPEFPEDLIFVVTRLVSYLKNFYACPTLENAKEIIDTKGLEIYGEHKNWNEKLPQIALDVIELSKINRDNRISFDDMPFLCNHFNLVKPEYELINVDESQDSSEIQLNNAVKAVKPNGRICLVGDSLQGCYSWRGSLANAMGIFKQKLNAQELKLTISFRCPKKVVEHAKSLVPDFQAHEFATEGEVTNIPYDNLTDLVKPYDIILSRTNQPLTPLCLKLIRQKTSAIIQGRDTAKQLIYLVKSFEAKDGYDFGNKLDAWQTTRITLIGNKGGKNSGKKIELIKEQYETLKAISNECISLEKTGTQDIINSINSIFYDLDYVKKPSVICSTSHRFKGLEANNIYMLYDTYNLSHPNQTQAEKDEEKNLLYISYSRAKKKLIIVNGLGKP